jgi:hypothetical protein
MIALGGSNLANAYIGANQIQKIYLGATEVWSSFDPDALAVVNAIVAQGRAVSDLQKNAINNFFVAGKSGGWYSLVKRLYLPIWGSAGPNAIDWITRTSGTFVGGVNHTSNSINSITGLNGYFDLGVSPQGLGMGQFNGGYFWAGAIQGGNIACIGTAVTSSDNAAMLLTGDGPPNVGFRYLSNFDNRGRIGANFVGVPRNAIMSAYGYDGKLSIYNRRASTRTTLISEIRTGFGSAPNTNIWALRINQSTTWGYRTQPTYFFGCTLGLSDAQDQSFTLALKTLWETCTGSTIPV